MKQTIDISPEKVGPIARAATRFLTLETTLVPGNLRQQLAVLEVFLSGLSTGELVLATPAPPAVELDVIKSNDDGEGEPEKVPAPPELSSEDRESLATTAALGGPTGAGSG